ncbi:hypothetical protein BGW38_008367 [Lunasporangiospora selenospora]|uniref:Lipase (Class 2) n=1 Tax=Lunasporangiospora selenospora TaxID=979761 RepID=A0A9P6FY18_9FUNG|nr:hypothetical protein BGW38_008367 [Lunasporangiospora selenospora]
MKFLSSTLLSIAFLALANMQVSNQVMAAPTPATADNKVAATMPQIEKRAISGINNYNCKLTAEHPRPVILVHATLLTADSWWYVAPALVKRGYCVFALTYGQYKGSAFGGLSPIEDSAQELKSFSENVMAKLNATQVDLVGHSQGGILGRYWVKFLDGKGKVNRMVGISAINQGTNLSGIVIFAKVLGLFTPSQPIFDAIAPSFYQMVDTSAFMAKLNKGGDTAPGVIHSNIGTRFDQVVTPYTNSFQKSGSGIPNLTLQNLCLLSLNEHLTMVNSNVVLQYVLNQLDPTSAKTANCISFP